MNVFKSMGAKLAVFCLGAALTLSLAACGDQKAEQKAADKPAVEAKPAPAPVGTEVAARYVSRNIAAATSSGKATAMVAHLSAMAPRAPCCWPLRAGTCRRKPLPVASSPATHRPLIRAMKPALIAATPR